MKKSKTKRLIVPLNLIEMWSRFFKRNSRLSAIVPVLFTISLVMAIVATGNFPLPSDDVGPDNSVLAKTSGNSSPDKKMPPKKKLSLHDLPNLDDTRRIAVSGFTIQANGKNVAFVSTQIEADRILEGLKKRYTTSGIQEAWFVETIAIKPDRLDIVRFEGSKTSEEVIALITQGFLQKTHTVVPGENLWLIAEKYNVPIESLIAANQGISPEKVKAKQVINLTVPNPLISVATKEITEVKEQIPFEVSYENSPTLLKGESKVRQEGTQGERIAKVEIIRINGQETERKVLEEKMSKSPVSKVVVKGTKTSYIDVASGDFGKPTIQGMLTSRSGSRGGTVHQGIDIGIPIGSQVKASAGGRVIYSGFRSDYGYHIIIDHGGGITTLYAHNSELLVKKGDAVDKGQMIAKSGNTGRSTGPHLHFEVKKNGKPVNPLGYVKY